MKNCINATRGIINMVDHFDVKSTIPLLVITFPNKSLYNPNKTRPITAVVIAHNFPIIMNYISICIYINKHIYNFFYIIFI